MSTWWHMLTPQMTLSSIFAMDKKKSFIFEVQKQKFLTQNIHFTKKNRESTGPNTGVAGQTTPPEDEGGRLLCPNSSTTHYIVHYIECSYYSSAVRIHNS